MTSPDLPVAYRQPMAAVLAALGSDAAQGLTTAEARRRLAQYGPNELQAEPPLPAWRKFLAQSVPLRASDWLTCVLVASSVLWLRELSKALHRSVASWRPVTVPN